MPAGTIPAGYTHAVGMPTYGTYGTLTNDVIWGAWNSAYSTGATTYSTSTTVLLNATVWGNWNTVYTETREQQAERERRQAELTRAHQERTRVAATARARAEELLLSLLSDEQAASYRDKGWFEVTGSKGGRWRIRNRGQSGNVDLMPEIGEEREATYCAHPPGQLPDADAYVAQMLQIVTDEDAFVKVANEHWRRPARPKRLGDLHGAVLATVA